MCASAPASSPVLFQGRAIGVSNREQVSAPTRPLLSLCIPTHNRSGALRSLLHSLVGPCAPLGDSIEILVLDDASDDDTASVLMEYEGLLPLVHARHSQHEGPGTATQVLASVLARGEFCWFLDDSSLVLPDGPARLLDILRTQKDLDFVFANSVTQPRADYEAKRRDGLVHSADFPAEGPRLARRPGPSGSCCFDELVDPTIDPRCLCSQNCAVIRTGTWRVMKWPATQKEDLSSSLHEAFPVASLLARTMAGRKAHYLETPVSITFLDNQAGLGAAPRFRLLQLQELLSLHAAQGVHAGRIQRFRKALVAESGEALAALMLDPAVPGHDSFDLMAYLRANESCAQLVFGQLDLILGLAQRHSLANRHLQVARSLVERYPNRRETPPPPPASRTLEGFKACIDKVPELVRLGRLEEAVRTLNEAKTHAPNQECVDLVLNYFAMFVRNKIMAFPSPQRAPVR